MKRDVRTRIRRRIRARLDELNMTARELAKTIGHSDAWISGILKGDYGVEWKDFDAICEHLRMEPSDLVRYDDSELRELTPSEMHLLTLLRAWPDGVRRTHLALIEHFSTSIPDSETANLLDQLRRMPGFARRAALTLITRTLEEGIPREEPPAADTPEEA